MPAPDTQPRTLYDKIWDDHVVYVYNQSPCLSSVQVIFTYPCRDIDENGVALIYVDRQAMVLDRAV